MYTHAGTYIYTHIYILVNIDKDRIGVIVRHIFSFSWKLKLVNIKIFVNNYFSLSRHYS
jgi:hypothetical protein